MSQLPTNPSQSTRRLNPNLYPGGLPCDTGGQVDVDCHPEGIPVNTDEAKLNKTERAFLDHLRVLRDCWVGVQCITLKLADDCRYTPDFWDYLPAQGLTAYEVKGFWRDDAKVKIKVAARMFPWIRFVVVKRGPNALVPWLMETVKP